MSFVNLYYQRTAATAKACYVCYKPTTTVLATINSTDFLYTCPGHLADPGFARPVVDDSAAKKPDVSPEEIARVKAEWEERQKKKREKEAQDQEAKDKEGDKGDSGEKKDKAAKPKETSPIPSPPASTPSHPRFTLHRDFFAMRQGEHRKRRQTAQAKELAPRLPGAPRGGLA